MAVFATSAAYFFYRWYTVRMRFRKLKAIGLRKSDERGSLPQPMMPHSLLWGHLGKLFELLVNPKDMPDDMAINYLQWHIVKDWKRHFPEQEHCPHVIYIDWWPLSVSYVLVTDPAVASQYLQNRSAPKIIADKNFVYAFTRNLDLISMDGDQWKEWRSRANPCFSARNILAQLPDMLEEMQIFTGLLKDKAGKDGAWGQLFQLEEAAMDLTFDVVCRTTVGASFGAQGRKKGQWGIREAFDDIAELFIFDVNIFSVWFYISPMRNYRLWRGRRIIDQTLMPFIEEEATHPKVERSRPHKTILEAALKNYKGSAQQPKLKGRYLETILGQLKGFLFGGHDTTATSLCWAIHLLQKHPEALEKLRAEHDAVFGSDPQLASQSLHQDPALINSLPYTTGVIKETLRLYPSIVTSRKGSKDLKLVNVPGYPALSFPTEGMMLWDGAQAIQMRDDLWTRATEFVPERWSATAGDPLYPPRDGLHAFSVGPRSCIAKDFALTEMKLGLVMLSRELDFAEPWDEWDRQQGRPEGVKGIVREYGGDRLYQIRTATVPRLKDGMPVKVRLRQ
ncbi:hypothetical protein FZEAL_9658 [Fusarium zealandicum]|uniref:Cytochrome P450 n=1 Tax=Fusarium zealandicum TaxID=1053134 RepID=A0A8H4U9A3_9HYPO|nr:hypothetical protein FZEAL_9658 [Fusarium zealandicum]